MDGYHGDPGAFRPSRNLGCVERVVVPAKAHLNCDRNVYRANDRFYE